MPTRTLLGSSIVLLALGGAASAQRLLETAQFFPESASGHFAGLGDVDGVNGDDLLLFEGPAAPPTEFAAFRVYFNDGAGGFTPGAPVPLPAATKDHQPLIRGGPAFADVTGDGVLDVLIGGHYPEYSFGIYPGLAGGGFGPFVGVLLENVIIDAAVGDPDADGVPEIAVMNRAVNDNQSDLLVRWWDWNGAGFTPSATVTIPGAFPAPSAQFLVSLDTTGDGVDDLVTGSRYAPSVRWLPTVGGNPTLGAEFPLGIEANSLGVALAVGDLDRDGDEDLLATGVIINPGTPGTHVQALFFQGAAVALGPPQVSLDYPPDPTLIDWDGDGDPDIAGHGTEGVLYSQGAAMVVVEHFTGGVFSSDAFEVRTNQSGELAGAADLDGDGLDDVLLPEGVVFSNGEFGHLPAFVPGSFDASPPGLLDWQDDGDVDLYFRRGQIYPNDATGTFDDFDELITAYPAAPVGDHYGQASAIGDFTGDGRADFLTGYFTSFVFTPVFLEMRLIADDGLGGFVNLGSAAPPGAQLASPFGKEMLVQADVDADGDLDVFTTDGYWANDGTGFFAAFTPLFSGEPADAGDADADGDLDVLTFPVGTVDALTLQRNQGGLAFTPELLFGPGTFLSPHAVLRDVEGDGDLDALAPHSFEPFLYVLENQGASFALTTLATLHDGSDFVEVLDADGDGLGDLVTASETPFAIGNGIPRVCVFRRAHPTQAVWEPARIYAGCETTGFADVDSDGDVDLIGGFRVRNASFGGAGDGLIRQYGEGTPGTGLVVPVLGARGPVRPGTKTAELRVRDAVGGSIGFLVVGTAEAAVPNVPFFGATTYVSNFLFVAPFPLAGAPGVAGAGTFDLPLSGFAPLVAGLTFYHQAAIADAGIVFGASVTNGLQITYGL